MNESDVQALEVVDLRKLAGGILSKKIPGGLDLWRRIRNSGYIRNDLYYALPPSLSNGEELAVFEAKQLIKNHPNILEALNSCECIRREWRFVLPTVIGTKKREKGGHVKQTA